MNGNSFFILEKKKLISKCTLNVKIVLLSKQSMDKVNKLLTWFVGRWITL